MLEIIRKKKLATATVATVATHANQTRLTVAKVASVAVAKQKSGKVVIPEDIKLEERRKKVLSILAVNPDTQRAIITDLDSDPDNVILTIAIRDHYSFEMLISKDRYDAFSLLELMQCPPQGVKSLQETNSSNLI